MDNFKPYNGPEAERQGKKKNKGIICGVRNCVYNDGDGKCSAEKIAVGPSYATSCTDTVCATFRQRLM